MFTSMWFVSLAALLVVDVRIKAQLQKDAPRRCFHCANGTSCDVGAATTVECSLDHPLCATSAVSPNFTSGLICAAATSTPCTLTNYLNVYTLICTCRDDMCNLPFSKQLQKQLLDFSFNTTQHNSSDYTKVFFQMSPYANITDAELYKAITVQNLPTTVAPTNNITEPTTPSILLSTHTSSHMAVSHPVSINILRAEALKHDPTAISEDDEDASEGSGSYEDSRTQRQPASDPADPSSFLPASENKAPTPLTTFLVTTSLLLPLVA